MALAPSPSTAQPAELEPALLQLPRDLRLTPEQFERVCQANPEAVLELAADGALIAMTPTGGETSSRNAQLLYQLQGFCRRHKGWRLFDSSGGFRLPDGSVLSPDASLVLEERWQALTTQQRRSFPPLCPDLVVEIASVRDASPSDEGPRGFTALRRKMAQYQANGARLGWLLLPEERAVEIWRGGEQEWLSGWRMPPGWRGVSWRRVWRWSWRRSGRCEVGCGTLSPLTTGITPDPSRRAAPCRAR